MKEMNYAQFRDEVKASIKDYLTEDYQDYEMSFKTIKKSSGYEYEALMISPIGHEPSAIPALNLEDAFERYQNGKSLEEILNWLADIRMNATIKDFNKEDMLHYDRIKDKIIPRLVNKAANVEYLSDKPHQNLDGLVDLSLFYAVRVSEDEEGCAEAVITNDLAEMWGIDAQELHEQAMKNNAQRTPLFKNLEDAIFGMGEPSYDIEDINPEDFRLPFFILTAQRQNAKGAVMILNTNVMNRITAKLGDAVYIIPSSIHETLIVSKDHVDNLQDLVDMLEQVNDNEVKPEDRLSYNIYEYNSETGFKIANSKQVA
ncbi:MAG: DUF5688 family protein [Saccharofermentans sp.]|nr:DUF5688 family protein [Saccharofermentans sp.]